MGISAGRTLMERRLQDSLDRRRIKSTLRSLTLPSASQVDFSSNDFLSLSKCPKLKAAFLAEIRNTNIALGSGGSRLLDGNSEYAECLERDIAQFHGAEAGLLFNSGFDANAGLFACIPQPGDIIVYDELIHASVHDGIRMSRATQAVSFRHNSVSDLRQVLQYLNRGTQDRESNQKSILVAIEAIYSMDGDIAPLKEILDVVDEVLGPGRGHLIIDEAHSTGVLGQRGAGLVSELGLQHRVFARLHTFGKSLAGTGAIVLGSDTLRQYLINYARPLIYSTFLAYPSLVLIRAAYDLLQDGETAAMQAQLHLLIKSFFTSLHELQERSVAVQTLLKIPNACPKSSIFAIQLQDPKSLARALQNGGFMVRAVVPPTVPLGTQRIRICLHAGNTEEELDDLIRALKLWCDAQLLKEQGHNTKNMGVLSRL
ncbi:PLP-dependent transferase [Setomelanomma holmii]|uniref:PLP-dependent transferase n=1 Tax=Setomelanomma holmii TaxID=210430 RepID=A0A9P4HBK1_9PLEO|nr:PLP-dependent transferase [Setomelanomma holmii]